MSEELKTVKIAIDRIHDLYDVYKPLWEETVEAFEDTWKWIPIHKYAYHPKSDLQPMRILTAWGSARNSYRLKKEYMPFSPMQLFFPAFR